MWLIVHFRCALKDLHWPSIPTYCIPGRLVVFTILAGRRQQINVCGVSVVEKFLSAESFWLPLQPWGCFFGLYVWNDGGGFCFYELWIFGIFSLGPRMCVLKAEIARLIGILLLCELQCNPCRQHQRCSTDKC